MTEVRVSDLHNFLPRSSFPIAPLKINSRRLVTLHYLLVHILPLIASEGDGEWLPLSI